MYICVEYQSILYKNKNCACLKKSTGVSKARGRGLSFFLKNAVLGFLTGS